MDNLEKNIKSKKILSVFFLVISTVICLILGYYSIAFLIDSIKTEESVYVIGMIILLIPYYIFAFVSLFFIIVSIIIQSKLKEKKSIFQFVYSLVILFLNVAFPVLYYILLVLS